MPGHPDFHHPRRQLLERYGIDIGSVEKLAKLIRERKYLRQFEGHGGKIIFDVPWTQPSGKQFIIRVVMDPTLKAVITILPPEFRSDRNHRIVKQSKQRHFKEMRRHFRDEEDALVTPFGCGDEDSQ